MSVVHFSPTDLRHCAAGLDEAGNTSTTDTSTLTSTLDGLGTCWGVKSVGQSFGSKYVPAATEVRAALGQMNTFLADFANSLREAADQYERTEHANTVK